MELRVVTRKSHNDEECTLLHCILYFDVYLNAEILHPLVRNVEGLRMIVLSNSFYDTPAMRHMCTSDLLLRILAGYSRADRSRMEIHTETVAPSIFHRCRRECGFTRSRYFLLPLLIDSINAASRARRAIVESNFIGQAVTSGSTHVCEFSLASVRKRVDISRIRPGGHPGSLTNNKLFSARRPVKGAPSFSVRYHIRSPRRITYIPVDVTYSV